MSAPPAPHPDADRLPAVALGRLPDRLRCWEWYYLKRLGHREALRLPGDHGRYSPDGKLIATAFLDNILLHDAATEEKRHTWMLPRPPGSLQDHIADLTFGPGGRTIAVAGLSVRAGPAATSPGPGPATGEYEAFVAVFDTSDGAECVRRPLPLKGRLRYDCRLAFRPDGRRLAVLSYQAIEIRDPATGHELLTLDNVRRDGTYVRVFFSRDGHRLFLQQQGPLRYWDATPLPPPPPPHPLFAPAAGGPRGGPPEPILILPPPKP